MTRTTRLIRTPAALVALAGVFVAAHAQPARGPLAGPRVDAERGPAGIAQRNIDGSMQRPDVPVAEAALRLVDLDDATRAKVDALLAERAKAIDGIVRANLQPLSGMLADRAAARNAAPGEGASRREAQREQVRGLMEMFKPVLEKGPLEEQIAAILPEQARVAYLSHIDEHREMMIAQRRARGGPEGERPGGPRGGFGGPGADDGPMLFDDPMLEMDDAPPPPPRGERQRRGARDGAPADRPARQGQGEGGPDGPGGPFAGPGGPREMLIQMGELRSEIRRSMERLTGEKQAREADLAERLGITPEQSIRVHEILRKAREAGRDAENPREARLAAMAELREILTPEQFDKLRESWGGQARRRPAGEPGERPARRRVPND